MRGWRATAGTKKTIGARRRSAHAAVMLRPRSVRFW
jgi:hypothetical protein